MLKDEGFQVQRRPMETMAVAVDRN